MKCRVCGTEWEKGGDKNIIYICPKCGRDEEGSSYLEVETNPNVEIGARSSRPKI